MPSAETRVFGVVELQLVQEWQQLCILCSQHCVAHPLHIHGTCTQAPAHTNPIMSTLKVAFFRMALSHIQQLTHAVFAAIIASTIAAIIDAGLCHRV